jgi:hypothetical protein
MMTAPTKRLAVSSRRWKPTIKRSSGPSRRPFPEGAQEAENLYHQSVSELKEHGLFGGHRPDAD